MLCGEEKVSRFGGCFDPCSRQMLWYYKKCLPPSCLKLWLLNCSSVTHIQICKPQHKTVMQCLGYSLGKKQWLFAQHRLKDFSYLEAWWDNPNQDINFCVDNAVPKRDVFFHFTNNKPYITKDVGVATAQKAREHWVIVEQSFSFMGTKRLTPVIQYMIHYDGWLRQGWWT